MHSFCACGIALAFVVLGSIFQVNVLFQVQTPSRMQFLSIEIDCFSQCRARFPLGAKPVIKATAPVFPIRFLHWAQFLRASRLNVRPVVRDQLVRCVAAWRTQRAVYGEGAVIWAAIRAIEEIPKYLLLVLFAIHVSAVSP